ncbi:uncharacterized protein N7503_008277 [Penicillium pulvis]|uniref:uncharacterized protein n=1 Tax=Penicillium pulvis TaxID=1562058 RepID=UPI0025477599|nr:uncharacterized protein N7503_008277 [Penicillium pulvis]KAJ5792299.1 hypothetical protein N7503_008277 [Penicillium pulvis]
MAAQILLSVLLEAEKALAGGVITDPNQREELSQVCERLCLQFHSPTRRLDDLSYRLPELVAVKIAIDMGIFDTISYEESGLTAASIASTLGVDNILVERVMRSLAVSGLAHITPVNTYKPDPCVKDFRQGGYMRDQMIFLHDVHYQVFPKLADFLAETNYRNPGDADCAPFQMAMNTKEHFFEWLGKREKQQEAFNCLMQTSRGRKYPVKWPDIFPVQNRFSHFRGVNASKEIQYVDIGGGVGQEIETLVNTIPDLSGLFILQDIPEVVASSSLGERVPSHETQHFQLMGHNFFQPQPVKGADFYFLGRILHDWPDIQARQILGHIRDAMDEHSVLLVHDRVLSDIPSEVFPKDIQADFIMMAIFASLERSETQFRELLKSAGLVLLQTWRPERSLESRQAVLEIMKE